MSDFRCIAPDVKLGQNVRLAQFVNLYGCTIGDDTKLGTFVEIQKHASVGSRCKISSHTFTLFLQEYAACGLINQSAQKTGVTAECVRLHRKADPAFEAEVKAAYEEFQERIEREALNRAVEGWQEPVFHRGDVVGHVTRKSDRILELILKRHIPEYRDRHQVDMNVTGGVLAVPAAVLSSEDWEKQQQGGKN